MSGSRTSATVVGVLFFVATAAYLSGSALIASAVNAPDSLSNLNNDKVTTGVFLEFINAAAVVGIAALLFPSLRKYNEGMALGYAASRTIECALLLVSALCPLLLVSIGNTPQLQTLGLVAMKTYDLAFQMAMVVLGTGSLLLCYVLYRFKLVPRALAALGFVGYIALLAAAWLAIFGRDNVAVLFAPGAIFEIVFPLWLIARGLNARPQETVATVNPQFAHP
jgi:hypothetical protein